MNPQTSILPQYAYLQCISTDFAKWHWMPTQKSHNDLLVTGVANCMDQQDGISNRCSHRMTTCTAGEQSGTSWCSVGNNLNSATGYEGDPVTSFREQYWPPPEHLGNSPFLTVRIDLMTVEQTAAWIRTLSICNGWEEADWYAYSFHQNGICGHQLGKLTLDSLKFDLGIVKYGHRLEIKTAIERLYPGLSSDGKVKSEITGNERSPISELLPGTESEALNIQRVQTSKLLNSSTEYKTTQQDMSPSICNMTSYHNHAARVLSSVGSVLSVDRNKEVLKNFDEPPTNPTNMNIPNVLNSSKIVQLKTPKAIPAKVLYFNVSNKNNRARPDNPVKYKALRNVKIRSGKSVRTDTAGYLTKGSVVVINQIKGRSGRVVVPQPDGDFTKVGWVTLYTHDRQQLMEKLNYNRQLSRTKR